VTLPRAKKADVILLTDSARSRSDVDLVPWRLVTGLFSRANGPMNVALGVSETTKNKSNRAAINRRKRVNDFGGIGDFPD